MDKKQEDPIKPLVNSPDKTVLRKHDKEPQEIKKEEKDAKEVPAQPPPVEIPKPQPIIRKVRKPVAAVKPAVEEPKSEKPIAAPQKRMDKDPVLQKLSTMKKQIKQSQHFKDIIAKFWALLQITSDHLAPRTELMKLCHRIFKVLVPRYNFDLVNTSILSFLAYFSPSCNETEAINLNVFAKILFNIAHIWCPNVSLHEYLGLLELVYYRIIKVVDQEKIPIQLIVTFPEEEDKVKAQMQVDENQEWLPCKIDEMEDAEWEYTFKEQSAGNKEMMKFKRRKPKKPKGRGISLSGTICAEEEIRIAGDIGKYTMQLADIEHVLPLGYLAETYLTQLFNEKDEKADSVSSLLTEDVLIKNAIQQKKKNEITKIPIKMHCQLPQIECLAHVGDIAQVIIKHLITKSKEHKLQMKVPIIATTKDQPLPLLDLKCKFSLGLQRKITFESLILTEKTTPTFINLNYSLERVDIIRAIQSQIKFKSENDNLVLNPEDTICPQVHSASAKKRGEDENAVKDANYNNDIELSKYLQLLMSNKMELIRREFIKMGGEAAASLSKDSAKIEKKPIFSVNALHSKREVAFDAWVSDAAVIDYAKKKSLAILVIGKPRTGKTTLMKELAKKLDLIYIEPGVLLQKLLEKVANYQPPTDLPEGQPPPKFLSEVEEAIMSRLKKGSEVSDFQTISMLNEALNTEEAQLKGFVLDLPLYPRKIAWAELISRKRLKINRDQFTYIIELDAPDEDVEKRAEEMRYDIESNETLSKWERVERTKPIIPPKKDEDEEEEGAGGAPPQEEQQPPKILDEMKILQLVPDFKDKLTQQLAHYKLERPAFQGLINSLPFSSYIMISNAVSYTPSQLLESVLSKIPEKALLRPLARSLDPEGDFKNLLTQGLEENAIPRKVSPWKMVDPVSLHNGKLEFGSTEQATHYGGFVFVHANEKNKKDFMSNPCKYLCSMPKMPDKYKIAVIGQKGAGKKTMAAELNKKYGWKIIDVEKLIKMKVDERREKLKAGEQIKSNNPEIGEKLSFSANEFTAIMQAKGIDLKEGLILALDEMGLPLEKKVPVVAPPEGSPDNPAANASAAEEIKKEENPDESKKEDKKEEAKKEEKKVEEEIEYFEDEEMMWVEEIVYPEGWQKPEEVKKEEEKKEEKKQEGAAVESKKEEAKKEGEEVKKEGEEEPQEEEEEEVVYEDLALSEIALKPDEKKQLPAFGGYILVGLPTNEEQIARMKELNFIPDKIIILSDLAEDNPGVEIKKRLVNEQYHNIEADAEQIKKAKGLCSEAFGEGNIIEVNCNTTAEVVFYKICNSIDPFFPRVDEPSFISKTTQELQEGQRPLPKGEYVDFCPITLKKEKLLLVGDPETEVQYKNKTYRFSGPNEMEEFKINPAVFVNEGFQKPPYPHIMFIGVRGSGVTTQLQKLSTKYDIPVTIIKSVMMERIQEEKLRRKEMRKLLKGFKPKPVPEDPAAVDPAAPEEEDPEIVNEPEDFDKAKHEKEVFKEIIHGNNPQLLDGRWLELGENVSTPLVEMMHETRRVPEVVVYLQINKKRIIERLYKDEEIKSKYDKLMADRAAAKAKRKKEREEERKKKLAEEKAAAAAAAAAAAGEGGEQNTVLAAVGMTEPVKEEEEPEEPEDPAEIPDLAKMQQEAKDALLGRFDTDAQAVDELIQQLTGKRITVITIQGDQAAEVIEKKVAFQLKNYLTEREFIFDRGCVYGIESKEVPFYEKSYCIRASKFGKFSPVTLSTAVRTNDFVSIYRDHLYYCASQDELVEFMKKPAIYSHKDTVPLELNYNTKCFILGPPKSAKTTLSKRLMQSLGLVHLKISHIIKLFMEADSCIGAQLRGFAKSGKNIPDEVIVQLLKMRLQMADCVENGWALENFPNNLEQANYLTSNGIIPDFVFILRVPRGDCLKRKSKSKVKFGVDDRVFAERARAFYKEIDRIDYYYSDLYENVKNIDCGKSQWFMEDLTTQYIKMLLQSKQGYAKNFQISKPGGIHMLNLLKQEVWENASNNFVFLCPVCAKQERKYVNCKNNIKNIVEQCSGNAMYSYFFTCCENHKNLLISSFGKYASSILGFLETMPQRVSLYTAAEKAFEWSNIYHLNGHCPVTLVESQNLQKGNSLSLCKYKGKIISFTNCIYMNKFAENPLKYEVAQLPSKMPMKGEKVKLDDLAKKSNSVPFLEETLGQLLTNGLLEIGNNRHKYPTLSVRETGLKLFALYLKANNPNNTKYMKQKYQEKMSKFVEECELPGFIYHETTRKGTFLNICLAYYQLELLQITLLKQEENGKIMKTITCSIWEKHMISQLRT